MSSAAVTERRNKQIEDAIEGGNLKQALQLCEKRIKKGENTSFLKAWKAKVLTLHPDSAHRERGITEALELCQTTPPITELDALVVIHDTLARNDEHHLALRDLWQNAAKASPKNEDIQLRWFSLASEAGDWPMAQKAAMNLQVNFPRNRKYYFWAVIMCYLIAVDPLTSPSEKNLFGTLASRMISKAADNVPTNPKELLSPGRAIQTAEELSLLIKIYEYQGRFSDIVSLLESQHLGISSRIAQNDWLFVTTQLSALEKACLWEKVFSFAKDLLSIPKEAASSNKLPVSFEEKDDWRVWDFLITATNKLGTEEAYNDTETIIESYINIQPKSRNAQLARLEFRSRNVSIGREPPSELLTACKVYFDLNQKRLYCFQDLRSYLAILDKNLQKEFHTHLIENLNGGILKKTDDTARGIPSINTLKFEYCFRLSSKAVEEAILDAEKFAGRCLEQFQSSRPPASGKLPSSTETEPSDDFCLLAAMSLIRAYTQGLNSESCPTAVLIQAAGILDHLLLKSPHNYEALLLLVRIYLLLGAGSLALKTFSQLTVKQIQHDTVSHNLFTRISSIHPQSAPPFSGLERKDYDPQVALRQALNFYRNGAASATQARSAGLEHGNYSNIEGSIDLEKSLKYSICRKMWALELRKIQRLVGGPSTKSYDDIVFETRSAIDKRSYDGFPNCELPENPDFEQKVRLGPLLMGKGVEVMVLTDSLLNYLHTDPSLRKDLTSRLASLAKLEPEFPRDELTPVEIENAEIHHLLIKLISISSKLLAPTTESAESILSRIEEWLHGKISALTVSKPTDVQGTINITSESSTVSPAPSWIYLHSSISLIETLHAIVLFVSSYAQTKSNSKSKSSSLSKEQLEPLKISSKKLADIIKSNTRMLKTHIAGSGMLGQLVFLVTTGPQGHTNELAAEIEKMINSSSVELFCGSLMESWEEALDGVILICSSV